MIKGVRREEPHRVENVPIVTKESRTAKWKIALLKNNSGNLTNLYGVEDLSAGERARVRNREIGFIFQAFNLIGDLTVYENVELPLTYRGTPSAERPPHPKPYCQAVNSEADFLTHAPN